MHECYQILIYHYHILFHLQSPTLYVWMYFTVHDDGIGYWLFSLLVVPVINSNSIKRVCPAIEMKEQVCFAWLLMYMSVGVGFVLPRNLEKFQLDTFFVPHVSNCITIKCCALYIFRIQSKLYNPSWSVWYGVKEFIPFFLCRFWSANKMKGETHHPCLGLAGIIWNATLHHKWCGTQVVRILGCFPVPILHWIYVFFCYSDWYRQKTAAIVAYREPKGREILVAIILCLPKHCRQVCT